jgi:hypothetical protein
MQVRSSRSRGAARSSRACGSSARLGDQLAGTDHLWRWPLDNFLARIEHALRAALVSRSVHGERGGRARCCELPPWAGVKKSRKKGGFFTPSNICWNNDLWPFLDNQMLVNAHKSDAKSKESEKTLRKSGFSRNLPLPLIQRFGMNWRRDRSIRVGRR